MAVLSVPAPLAVITARELMPNHHASYRRPSQLLDAIASESQESTMAIVHKVQETTYQHHGPVRRPSQVIGATTSELPSLDSQETLVAMKRKSQELARALEISHATRKMLELQEQSVLVRKDCTVPELRRDPRRPSTVLAAATTQGDFRRPSAVLTATASQGDVRDSSRIAEILARQKARYESLAGSASTSTIVTEPELEPRGSPAITLGATDCVDSASMTSKVHGSVFEDIAQHATNGVVGPGDTEEVLAASTQFLPVRSASKSSTLTEVSGVEFIRQGTADDGAGTMPPLVPFGPSQLTVAGDAPEFDKFLATLRGRQPFDNAPEPDFFLATLTGRKGSKSLGNEAPLVTTSCQSLSYGASEPDMPHAPDATQDEPAGSSTSDETLLSAMAPAFLANSDLDAGRGGQLNHITGAVPGVRRPSRQLELSSSTDVASTVGGAVPALVACDAVCPDCSFTQGPDGAAPQSRVAVVETVVEEEEDAPVGERHYRLEEGQKEEDAEGRVKEDEQEDDSGSEGGERIQELQRSLEAQLQAADASHRQANARATRSRQQLRLLEKQNTKEEQRWHAEMAEARSELQASEQRAAARTRSLRNSAERAEATMKSVFAEIDEDRSQGVLGKAQQTSDDVLMRLRQDVLNAREVLADTELDEQNSKHATFLDQAESCRNQIHVKLVVLASLREAASASEEHIQHLAAEVEESSSVQETKGQRLTESVELLSSSLKQQEGVGNALRLTEHTTFIRLERAESEMFGFQEAMRLSDETAGKHLAEELGHFQSEAVLLQNKLETLNNQHDTRSVADRDCLGSTAAKAMIFGAQAEVNECVAAQCESALSLQCLRSEFAFEEFSPSPPGISCASFDFPSRPIAVPSVSLPSCNTTQLCSVASCTMSNAFRDTPRLAALEVAERRFASLETNTQAELQATSVAFGADAQRVQRCVACAQACAEEIVRPVRVCPEIASLQSLATRAQAMLSCPVTHPIVELPLDDRLSMPAAVQACLAELGQFQISLDEEVREQADLFARFEAATQSTRLWQCEVEALQSASQAAASLREQERLLRTSLEGCVAVQNCKEFSLQCLRMELASEEHALASDAPVGSIEVAFAENQRKAKEANALLALDALLDQESEFRVRLQGLVDSMVPLQNVKVEEDSAQCCLQETIAKHCRGVPEEHEELSRHIRLLQETHYELHREDKILSTLISSERSSLLAAEAEMNQISKELQAQPISHSPQMARLAGASEHPSRSFSPATLYPDAFRNKHDPGGGHIFELRDLLDLRESQLLRSHHASRELERVDIEEQHLLKAAEAECQDAARVLGRKLEFIASERDMMSGLVAAGIQRRQVLEQHLRRELQRLHCALERVTSPTNETGEMLIDERVLVQMGTVVRETYEFLCEQQGRLENVLLERGQLCRRLRDALTHLDGPSSARCAGDESNLEKLEIQRELIEHRQEQCEEHMAQLRALSEKQALKSAQASSLHVPAFSQQAVGWQPPPTIVEESPRLLNT